MKAYKVIKSNIHRKGLCAARNIKKGERIIEYIGKKITHKQADEDTKYGYDITYLFTLDKKYLLDGDFEFMLVQVTTAEAVALWVSAQT